MGNRFPAILEFLGHASAAFREAGVADRIVIHQYLSTCLFDHLPDYRVRCPGNTLVTLAMVVGTDIEQIMVLPVVPADQGLVVAVTTFIGRNRSVQVEILLDLCQEPASRDHGMGFQQLFGSVGAHLRGDYAGKVFLHVHLVDRDDTFIGRHEVQRSLEALILLSLPVKIHADRDRLQVERGLRAGRLEE